jgi:predicted Zn-dependent peptidase
LLSAFELLADIAVNASFNQADMDAERKVVREEMRLTEDNEHFMNRRQLELSYQPHPYGRSLLGPPETIRTLTRETFARDDDYAFDIETAEGLAKAYGQAETTWTLDNEIASLARRRQTTAAEVQAVARKYFADNDYARVRFVPRGAAR